MIFRIFLNIIKTKCVSGKESIRGQIGNLKRSRTEKNTRFTAHRQVTLIIQYHKHDLSMSEPLDKTDGKRRVFLRVMFAESRVCLGGYMRACWKLRIHSNIRLLRGVLKLYMLYGTDLCIQAPMVIDSGYSLPYFKIIK